MDTRTYKRLVLAPHVDDEVLGCSSMLDADTFVLYGGVDESHIGHDWVKQRPTNKVRLRELANVVKLRKFDYEILPNRVNEYTLQSLIPQIERAINKTKPLEIYLPVPSYNQDHRTMYEAALTALRPHDVNHYVKRVFTYEQIQDLWNKNYDTFEPNYFVPVDIDLKIKTYKLLKTQVRAFRSPDMLKTLAKLRGIQANKPYAESFKILRWVE
jgi:LmbE family N-acetylglucosaminyl deacetylase